MKTLKYISILLVLLTFSQCRTLEEYNQSPNQLEIGKGRPSDLMDELICNGALNYQQRFYDTFAELMQYTTVTSSSNEVIHRYYIAPSYIDNCWDNCAKWAANADHMYSLAVESGEENYQAIALTLRALWMDQLSAIFGMVPFSEAFMIRENVNKPKFDTEKEIYTQLIKDLDLANSLYDAKSTLSVPAKDKLYHGNTAKWQKFTNSLQLRILMRLSNRSTEMEIALGESVAQKIKKIVEDPSTYPLMTSWDDNACVYFSGESPFQNNWGGYAQSDIAGHRGSQYFIGELNGKGDPRKWIWFIPWSKSVGWDGVISGMPGDDTFSSGYPVLNGEIMTDTNGYRLPVSFMNYDEVCFILAEANYRNDDDHWTALGSRANAADWYYKGVIASCEFWRYILVDWFGIKGRTNKDYSYREFTAIEPMNDSGGIPLPISMDDDAIWKFAYEMVPFSMSNGIECIIKQKYIANFRVMTEAYNDYRRTGFPKLPIGLGTYNSGILPYRLVYPTVSKTTNPENYQALLDKLRATYYDGADNMLTPVWWSEAGLGQEIR